MLPKDLLKYAKQFSPKEIEQAILNAIKGVVKPTPNFDAWREAEMMAARQLAGISVPWGTIGASTSAPMFSSGTFTTTAAVQTTTNNTGETTATAVYNQL